MKVLNVVLVLLVIFTSSASARVGSDQRVLEPVDGVIPDEHIVTLPDGIEPRGLLNGVKNRLVNSLKESGEAEILYDYTIINGFAVHMNLNALQNALKNIEGAKIYPNAVATAIAVQSPVASWGLDRVDQVNGTNNEYQYARDGSNVDVYIIDTGIFIEHVDFEGRARYGADFTGEGNFDGDGHGTHVAGTVGGTTYGIAKKANLIAVKVLNSSGFGSWAGIIAGIDWVATQLRPNGAVINMSLGGDGTGGPVNDAVNRAVAAGVVVVVASGNANKDACGTIPASAADAITVGATDINDARASFSNFGSCVDIFAPGVGIVSCATRNKPIQFSARSLSGTSMASPHVAGVAALLLEENPNFTPAQIADKIRADATPGIVVNAGAGSPNFMVYTGAITGSTTTTLNPNTPLAPTPPPAPAPTPAPIPSCAADRASCTNDSDCCSRSCKGGGNNRFCN